MDKISLLVVEDDPLVLIAIEAALLDAGFNVLTAVSGSEAMLALDADDGQLKAVVTDIRMGTGPSGWDVARHARERSPTMPVIYASGDSADQWAVQGVPHSIMLCKPFAFPQLITALAGLLNEASEAEAQSGG